VLRRLAMHLAESVSRNGCWLFRIRSFASRIENHWPRSTSEISRCRPECGGHSIWQTLLLRLEGSQSPSKAHAVTVLPPACLMVPSSTKGPSEAKPVSSVNSLRAASNGGSPSTYSPFVIDHAPTSLLAQNGPPGWIRNISTPFTVFRYIIKPALRFPTFPHPRRDTYDRPGCFTELSLLIANTFTKGLCFKRQLCLLFPQ
jgi:hypothetical protein